MFHRTERFAMNKKKQQRLEDRERRKKDLERLLMDPTTDEVEALKLQQDISADPADEEPQEQSVIYSRWFNATVYLAIVVSSVQLGLEIDEVGYPESRQLYKWVET